MSDRVYWRGLDIEVGPPDIFWNVLFSFQRFLRLGLPLDTVLDIGAHHGSLSLLAAHSGATKVVAVEPVHVEPLEKNIERAGFKGVITPIPKAVTSESEVAIKFADCGGMQSILYHEDRTGDYRLVDIEDRMVRGVAFKDLLALFPEGIDYLKIDCEGAEWNFFECDDETKAFLCDKVRYIDFELHPISGFGCYDAESQLVRPEYRSGDGVNIVRGFLEQECGFDLDRDDEKFGFGIAHTKGANRG